MNIRMGMAVIAVLVIGFALPAMATPTAAPLNFCNRTSSTVGVAVGYYSSGVNDDANHDVLTGPFVSEGWWLVEAGQCQSLHNPFDARYMFWFPVNPASPTTYDDTTSPGKHMCVIGSHFTYEDQNASYEACHPDPALHSKWIAPHRVDTFVNPNVDFTGYDANY